MAAAVLVRLPRKPHLVIGVDSAELLSRVPRVAENTVVASASRRIGNVMLDNHLDRRRG